MHSGGRWRIGLFAVTSRDRYTQKESLRKSDCPLLSRRGEDPVDREIQSYEDLVVGIPEDNLTIVGVARQLANRSLQGADAKEGRAAEDLEERRADFDHWSVSSR